MKEILTVHRILVAGILKEIGFGLQPNTCLVIYGPNGSGKSTLTQFLSGVREAGPQDILEVECDGYRFNPKELKQWVANVSYVSSQIELEFDLSVNEFLAISQNGVELGDLERVLGIFELLRFKERSVRTLSAGEKQRLLFARAFLRNPKVMVLDETFSQLDLLFQKKIVALLKSWKLEPERAVVLVTHDLELARSLADRVVLMKDGEVFIRDDSQRALDKTAILDWLA